MSLTLIVIATFWLAACLLAVAAARAAAVGDRMKVVPRKADARRAGRYRRLSSR